MRPVLPVAPRSRPLLNVGIGGKSPASALVPAGAVLLSTRPLETDRRPGAFCNWAGARQPCELICAGLYAASDGCRSCAATASRVRRPDCGVRFGLGAKEHDELDP